jgi:hypothetical protein
MGGECRSGQGEGRVGRISAAARAIVDAMATGDPVRLPRGYWGPEQARPILDKVLTTRYEVDLGSLGPGERGAVRELVAAGRVVQDLSEHTEHHQALAARRRLEALHERLGRPEATADLLEMYAVFQGPIATTLDNRLLPFLPVDPWAPGRNVYPWAIAADEIQEFLRARPDRRDEILGSQTAVRRTTPAAVRRDLAVLRRQPALAALHPGLAARLGDLADAPTSERFYAIPYSVAWPDHVLAIADHLRRAADSVAPEDADLAAALRQRSRDLLVDDNEAGDAAWIRGSFKQLDVIAGAYESYDDDLFGVKVFFGLAILLREPAGTAELRELLRHLQEIEDSLPIDRHRSVAHDIPIGSYDVVAAFGQELGVLAEILPNDPELIRKYGRKILLRHNYSIAEGPAERVMARWRAAMAPVHHADLTPVGAFRQTTWHEIGHYLGPDTDRSGRSFDVALGEDANVFEELKSELLSAFAALWLHRAGAFTSEEAQAVIAACIMSGLRPVRPRRSQPYPTLWLMELNYFLENGLVRIEGDGLHIDHERAETVIESMLRETLAIMDHGSKADSGAYIERWSTWDERHERIAARLVAAEKYRTLFARFAILEDG